MTQRARIGLIGYGMVGAAFHAPLIAAEPRLTLAAIASSRRDAVAAAWPDAAIHADAAALIADDRLDAVVIASPNPSHAPLARAALAAGKHVVVEKPFVVDPADGAALIALAAARGRMLTVFLNRRWDGDFLTAARLVRDGVLGRIMLAEMAWDRFRPAIKPGWRERPDDGSGLLADLGPHLIDQALQLFGMPDHLSAEVLVQREAALVDDFFAMTLRYGAARVRLASSSLVASPRPRFALHGTRGSFVKYGIDPQEAHLRGGGRPGDADYGVEAAAGHGVLTVDGAATPVATERGDWRRFYAGVAAAIHDGAPPPVDPRDALAGLDLIALARRSAEVGRVLATG